MHMAQPCFPQPRFLSSEPVSGRTPFISPLMLSDRLLGLAEEVDRAGCRAAATQLLHLAHGVLERGALQ